MSKYAAHVEVRSARSEGAGKFRPHLARQWGAGPTACIVMLNPSTADGTSDDPTIRRCVGFAREWACGGLEVVNLYSLRATDPRTLFRAKKRIRPRDERVLLEAAARADLVIAAWGIHGAREGRGVEIATQLTALARSVLVFGLTKNQQPRHPLYVPRGAALRHLRVVNGSMTLA